MLDVAIAGGGPGGLACAHAIRRALPHVSVKVFEGTQRIVPQGAGVLMNVNGLAALHAIDPALEQRMADGGYIEEKKSLTSLTLQGEPQRGPGAPPAAPAPGKPFPGGYSAEFRERYGRNVMTLGWHEIRQTLLDALPPDTVQLGKKVCRYEESKEMVTVHFQDGSEPVQARILIGADGYLSKVRECMLGDGPPTFCGSVTWRARATCGPGLPPVTQTMWWKEEDFRKRFAVVFAFSPTQFCLVFSAPIGILEERGVEFDPTQRRSSIQEDDPRRNALQRCRQVFADADPFLLNILDNVLDPATVTEHGNFQRPVDTLPEQEYGRGRVTLVGDAAHVGPVNGQGLNLTLEDAAVLGLHLRDGGLNPDSLRRYEAERAPRVKEIIRDVTDFRNDEQKERLIFRAQFVPLCQVEAGES